MWPRSARVRAWCGDARSACVAEGLLSCGEYAVEWSQGKLAFSGGGALDFLPIDAFGREDTDAHEEIDLGAAALDCSKRRPLALRLTSPFALLADDGKAVVV